MTLRRSRIGQKEGEVIANIMRRRGLLAALVAVSALATASGQAQTFPLAAFTSISVCTPFSVLIRPSTNAGFQLVVDADAGVAPAVNASVVGTTLTLTQTGNGPSTLTFAAANPIKVAIELPADQLASIAVSSIPAITVAVAPGFAVPAFSASVSGTSTLSALSLQASQLEVVNAGTGNLYVAGTITAASITASGTGSTYIVGVTTSAAVDASGISKVFLSGAPALQITGQISGISSVAYDQGVCSISSQFGGIFGTPCAQQVIQPPVSLSTPQWSCGLTVYGSFGCSNGGNTASLGGGSTSSSSVSSGGGTSMTSSTVNGITTTTQSSSTGPAGTSSLVTDTGTIQIGACPVTGAALNMLPV